MCLRSAPSDGVIGEDDPQVSYLLLCSSLHSTQQRLSDLTPVSEIAAFLVGTAWGKICEALKEDFAPYLPIVMPDLLKSASLTPDISFVDGQYRRTLTGRVGLFVLISIADL